MSTIFHPGFVSERKWSALGAMLCSPTIILTPVVCADVQSAHVMSQIKVCIRFICHKIIPFVENNQNIFV